MIETRVITKNSLLEKLHWPVIASAILYSWSLITVNFLIGWVAFALLFYHLLKLQNTKKEAFSGFLFGFVSTLLLTYWMVPVVDRYAQGGILIGILCWILSSLLIGLVTAMQFIVFSYTKIQNKRSFNILINGALMASLWVIIEWIRSEAFKGFPWLSYSAGISQSSNLYLLQLASYGSVFLLSFIIIFVNYLLGFILYSKQWSWIFAPVLTLSLSFIVGYFLYTNISSQTEKHTSGKIKASLVLAALPPETVWDENNGNALVKHLLDLNKQAVASKPDLIVWSETIIPWTYSADDDFLKEIRKTAFGSSVLLGMNTALRESEGLISNSAYFFDNEGKVASRYDKQELLSVVEKPLFNTGNLILPFLASSGLKITTGNKLPIETRWGKAGILLCNEAAIPSLTRKYSKQEVSYLINMANDSWFSDTFIAKAHFYSNRLRAVEARKDVAVNSNMGLSGVMRANGDIAAIFSSKESSVQEVDIFPNTIKGFSYNYFLCFVAGITFLIAVYKLITELLTKSQNIF